MSILDSNSNSLPNSLANSISNSLSNSITSSITDLHTNILKSIPFDAEGNSKPLNILTNESSLKTSNQRLLQSSDIADQSEISQIPPSNLAYKSLTVNELYNNENEANTITQIKTGNKDLTLILALLAITLFILVLLGFMGIVVYNELQIIKYNVNKYIKLKLI